MLELQRASAGSGKTYALAKKFIWYYITIPAGENEPRRLRTDKELSDSLSHILAVTFTNKATNEMQQRIVDKLAALAAATDRPQPGVKDPDYLNDFLKELQANGYPATRRQCADTCRKALSLLLNNYSDFHVSTIDSFFQLVLRTFAYESAISDSYQVELDSDYLSQLVIDAILEDINTGHADPDTMFWVKLMMKLSHDKHSQWDIFSQNKKNGSPYSVLLDSAKRLENEEFKFIRTDIDNYFDSKDTDLKQVYTLLTNKYDGEAKRLFDIMTADADELQQLLSTLDIADADAGVRGLFGSAISRVKKCVYDNPGKAAALAFNEPNSAFQKRAQKNQVDYDMATEALDRLIADAERWQNFVCSREYVNWSVYRVHFPFLGLLRAIRIKRAQLLAVNNAVELGETNSILKEIIGEDDTPFIYERIGTRLNHFLIDEFQDTSKMQWDNIYPLLAESISRGNENMVIGDAKQSIYRFRNADSTLISQTVPDMFDTDEDTAQNTNWRSRLHVVQFNNSFFKYLASELHTLFPDENRVDFTRDYQNVVQLPRQQKDSGYVELHITEFDSKWKENIVPRMPELVLSLLSRGYNMRDIAILVRKRDEGESIISAFVEYNQTADADAPHIEFISEESLRLTSSSAVSMIISVLETICRGADPVINGEDEIGRKGVADWNQIKCLFRYYAAAHPGRPMAELLREFLSNPVDNSKITSMLGDMQAMSLPALVESIAAEFLPPALRRNDAAFIAAFQDVTLEYCERRPSDIVSFLDWWKNKGDAYSITSPEDTDAVQVMTIHKSKGLEFPVVIVPFADETFTDAPAFQEWRWVAPQLSTDNDILPPYMPITTSASLLGSSHEEALLDFYDLKKKDNINALYVALTRAVDELYIFANDSRTVTKSGGLAATSGEKRMSAGWFLRKFADAVMGGEEQPDIALANPDVMASDELPDKETVYRYGQPLTEEETAALSAAKSRKSEAEIIEEYRAFPTPDFLLYRDEAVPAIVDAEEYEEQEDTDPRSEGNLMHDIMSRIEVADDLPWAVKRMEIDGLLSPADADKMLRKLVGKLAMVERMGWFDGTRRVVNERPILHAVKGTRRPDRILIDRDGNATVIDYKFGHSEKTQKRYINQVREYMEWLSETGQFRSVTGYLWYVNLNKTIKV